MKRIKRVQEFIIRCIHVKHHLVLFVYVFVYLRHLGSQLCELEKLIDKMMVEDFSMYARSDLNRSLKDEPQILEKV